MIRAVATLAIFGLASAGGVRAGTIDAGDEHACAVVPGGKILCWGHDRDGKIGDDGDIDSLVLTPTEVDTSAIGPQFFTSVDAGGSFSCALTDESRLFCWGADDAGQLGDGEPAVAQPTAVEVTDGPAATGEHWTRVSAGASHACALDSAGQGWCWGADNYGQLGNGGPDVDIFLPKQVELPAGRSMVDISAGALHSCAVDDLGGAWCWGGDFFGQLGDGSDDGVKSEPVAVQGLVAPLSSISSGLDHTCALDVDGNAWCWGLDGHGQLGNDGLFVDANVARPVQQQVGVKFLTLSAGIQTTCAVDSAARVWCWGSDLKGQLGNDQVIVNSSLPVLVMADALPPQVEQVTAGKDFACASGRHGKVACWGVGKFGQLAGGYAGQTPTPVILDGVNAQQIAAGAFHTCTLSNTNVVQCWGSNQFGQLGDGSQAQVRTLPVTIDAAPFEGADLVSITAGESHTCVLSDEGSAWCWGQNSDGQLGSVGMLQANAPQPINLAAIQAMSRKLVKLDAGGLNTCGLDSIGDAWCWGSNRSGQLANSQVGGVEFAPSRVQADGFSFRDINVGLDIACAVTTQTPKAAVHCWGANWERRMGHSAARITNGKMPIPVDANLTVDRVDLGDHTCVSGHVVAANGYVHTVKCAGSNDAHQILGGGFSPIGFANTFSEPVTDMQVGRPLALAHRRTCLITQSTSIAHCFGYNLDGQLATGSALIEQEASDNPTLFGEVEAITAGERHTCAILAGGDVSCAGDRTFGQLGDGKAAQMPTPQPVPNLIVVGGGIFYDGIEEPAQPD